MLKVLVIPAWYDTANPLTGVFFHEYCNAMTSYCKVTLLNYEHHSFSKRWSKEKAVDKIADKKYGTLKMDYYNPFPGKWLGLSAAIQRKQILQKAIALVKQYMKQEGKFDVIHIQSVCNNMTPLIAVALSTHFKIPYLVTEHYTSFEEAGDSIYHPFTTYDEIKGIVRNASMRLAVSNYASNYCSNCFAVDFATVYNIISDKFNGGTGGQNQAKSSFNFLCIGAFKKRKGQEYLIRAFADIVKDCPDGTLTLVGQGPDESRLRALAVELGVEQRLTIMGHLSTQEFISVMKKASVLVSASQYELFGMTIVEAFFLGKPVLATRSGGPEELINSKNGLITDYADVKGMAENMRTVYRNYDRYDPTVIRNEAVNKFSAAVIGPQMLDKYQQVIKQQSNS